MARIRTVKPEFFTHSGLGELLPWHRLLFIGLWTQADRAGRLKDDAKKLKVVLLPYDDVDIDKLLQELQDCPESFIARYEVKGEKYIQINNFLDHQHPHIKELESTIPAPGKPGKTGARTRLAPVEPVGREGKGKEGDIGREGKEPPPESDKKVYGEFQNVLLTDKEFQKLTEKFGEPETLKLVERMSTGIASKGYKYKSHYATALTWKAKDSPQGTSNGTHKPNAQDAQTKAGGEGKPDKFSGLGDKDYRNGAF